jgi:hypothetical protein
MSNNGHKTDTDTTVTLLPSVDVKEFRTVDAESLVILLENCGGDLKKFIENANLPELPPEFIVYHTEKCLQDFQDKTLYKRWEAAIRLRKLSRLRIIQEKAFTALEEAANDLSKSPKNALDYAKVVLQEFLASQAVASKNALSAKDPEKEDEAAFEAELAEMEELG